MSEPIHEIDPATGLSRGIYAIDPSGHLITLGRTQSIKAGFRYATQGEIDGTSVAPAPQLEPESWSLVETIDSIVERSRPPADGDVPSDRD